MQVWWICCRKSTANMIHNMYMQIFLHHITCCMIQMQIQPAWFCWTGLQGQIPRSLGWAKDLDLISIDPIDYREPTHDCKWIQMALSKKCSIQTAGPSKNLKVHKKGSWMHWVLLRVIDSSPFHTLQNRSNMIDMTTGRQGAVWKSCVAARYLSMEILNSRFAAKIVSFMSSKALDTRLGTFWPRSEAQASRVWSSEDSWSGRCENKSVGWHWDIKAFTACFQDQINPKKHMAPKESNLMLNMSKQHDNIEGWNTQGIHPQCPDSP